MSVRPSILCPIDFSEASAGALRYAAAVASHFAMRLVVLTVEDPLLTEAADLGTGVRWDPDECKQEMAEFAGTVFGPQSGSLATVEYEVAVGKPAPPRPRTVSWSQASATGRNGSRHASSARTPGQM